MELKYHYKRDISYEAYLFHQGKNFQSYKFLGAHKEKSGVSFTVWAPRAKEVYLVGDFNDWQETSLPLKRFEDSGIWQIVLADVEVFQTYKYRIITEDDQVLYKADPFAFHAEERPKTGSKYFNIEGYKWTDKPWQKAKAKSSSYKSPMNIYEVNLLSWRKNPDGSQYSYQRLKKDLITYVKSMGYTHIELMPILEHPYDGSWGYQATGYFAPTSRFGTPFDFMDFVNSCHKNNIGVIMDWVPVHFAVDDFALRKFDGTYLYESLDQTKAYNQAWGSYNFDLSKNEVQSFLISSAIFWHDYYHIDGLRVDAVAYMLYLNYPHEQNEANINQAAVGFLRDLNTEIFKRFPNSLMIAEESTAWPNVSRPVDIGGLGFNYKWNMGWMNDILDYMKADPVYRKSKHDQLRFSFTYQYSENYILPFSHDEVVHGKKSLLDKMPGSYEEKFASLRLLLAYMIGHPGKKLNFMGNEFGQFIEWDEWKELDWFLLDYDSHKRTHDFVKDLNKFYKESSELFQEDYDPKGFQWVSHDNGNESILVFDRINSQGEKISCIYNFTPVDRPSYPIGVDYKGTYRTVFSTDKKKYGGSTSRVKTYKTLDEKFHGRDYGIRVDIPGLSALFIKHKS
ncbi:MAG: 1,4-alpha-glucan branching protein GlgB [Bacillota bacterium]|nr:1,4-alpha-glucan branching protein GlgB [Bacillota bacterium]